MSDISSRNRAYLAIATLFLLTSGLKIFNMNHFKQRIYLCSVNEFSVIQFGGYPCIGFSQTAIPVIISQIDS